MLIPAFAPLIAFFSESMRRDKTGCEKDNCGMIHSAAMSDVWQRDPVHYCTAEREIAPYYAIDFSLLSFNGHLLASSQGLHPVEIAVR